MAWTSLFFGAFLALAVQFGLLALALYPIMRREFLLWLLLRTAMIAVMVVTLSPIAASGWLPDEDLRRQIGGIANAISVAAVGPFLASYLERNIRLWRVRTLLRQSVWLGLLAAVAVVLIPFAPLANHVHDIALLLLIGVIVYGLVRTVAAGSRAALFQTGAWTPGIVVGASVLLVEIGTGVPVSFWLEAVFMALLVEFVVTTMGLVDGFMTIKRERDEALAEMHAAKRANATDPLTGIANRRGLQRHFDEGSRGRPKGLAIIDCDHFKTINDRFGHDMGDDVLVAVANGLRGEDVFAARLGGEEFIVLVYSRDWQSSAEGARRRITQAVRAQVPDLPLMVTASAGLASLPEGESLAAAMKRADRALYAAKDAGRNRSLALTEFHPRPEMMRIA
ncbi:diguanylate cyclase [Qipengyuania sp. MTN3-11]|uniref:GGDEF domain-containing protein n=1 Tax=Qipengyuania sp. MTN3-11 TaxID=3056557 RepID=UPI0036F3DA83